MLAFKKSQAENAMSRLHLPLSHKSPHAGKAKKVFKSHVVAQEIEEEQWFSSVARNWNKSKLGSVSTP